LSRKTGETIRISGPSTVTVLDIDRTKVRLGVDAAADVTIWRGELLAEDQAGLPRRGGDYGAGVVEGRRLCLELLEREAQRAGLGQEWARLRRVVDGAA
jgi:carbon storage regulator